MDHFRTTRPARFPQPEEEDKLLGLYLQGHGLLTLGQMLTIIGSNRLRTPLLTAFRDWLKIEHPWLATGLQRLRTDKIIALRNREDHADLQVITPADASTMRQTCYDLINLLHRNYP